MNELIPVKVGVVGCGNISDIYLTNSAWLDMIEIKGVTDLRQEMASAQAKKYGIPTIYDSLETLLADDEIEIVLNITQPDAHATVAQAVVEAGKSVYGEKPLTLGRAEGQKLLATAKANGVLVGSAPDTFFGAGHQTARKLIDDGVIGNPVSANAFMMSWGIEMWHPNPEFYYKSGGGPMFDMGPYYLTDMIFLLGPVAKVSGMVTTGRKQRKITSQPLSGQVIDVEVPTHVSGLMQFVNGAIGTTIMSFDVAGADLPRIEIHGDAGSISVPDPNRFGGPVKLRRGGENEWAEVELSHSSYAENSRGVGLNDMAYALRTGRSHRANGELAYHVLDLMHAFHDAAAAERTIAVNSSCARPAPLPVGVASGTLDR